MPELDLLAEFALGMADDSEIEATLARSPQLATEFVAYQEAAAALASSLPPIQPPPGLKRRLMASVAQDRFLPFLAQAARFTGLALDTMRDVLRRIDDPKAWEELGVAGLLAIHFEPGPAFAGADAGFLKMPAGSRFPLHRHLGPEVGLVLQGRMLDSDGQIYLPGDVTSRTQDDPHTFAAGDESELVLLVVYGGFEIL